MTFESIDKICAEKAHDYLWMLKKEYPIIKLVAVDQLEMLRNYCVSGEKFSVGAGYLDHSTWYGLKK